MSSFMVKKESGGEQNNFEVPPSGTHLAVLVAIVDLGTHAESFAGQPERDVRKVFLVWELVSERVSGATYNHVIGKEFTLSFHERSALCKMVERWRGKTFSDGEEFDLSKLLGQGCQVGIVHSKNKDGSRTYAKVDTILGLARGVKAPPAQCVLTAWTLDDGTPFPDLEWFPRRFGEKLSDVVARCQERTGKKPSTQQGGSGNGHGGDEEAFVPDEQARPMTEDEIPF